eukprot:6334899-Prymnesium_polylepis.1
MPQWWRLKDRRRPLYHHMISAMMGYMWQLRWVFMTVWWTCVSSQVESHRPYASGCREIGMRPVEANRTHCAPFRAARICSGST